MQPLIRPLPQAKINARNTALLVIDMENDFVAAAAVQETPGGRAIIPAINRLIAWARLLRIPIIEKLGLKPRPSRTAFCWYSPFFC